MLVFTRKIGQRVVIGDDIAVWLLAGKYGQLKLGIEAPIQVPVHRGEVYDRLQDRKGPRNEDDDKAS